jgi:predicted nucleotidyltransferase
VRLVSKQRLSPAGGCIRKKRKSSERGLIPTQSIQAYCRAIGREFSPDKIILFGSYAYGKPTPDSDVDLLVILPFRGNDVSKAIQIRSCFDTPFPLDLIVRKPEFISARLRERDMFIESVMNRGRVLYEGQHS